MFKSKKEFAQAMIDGRRFKSPSGGVCYFNQDALLPFRVSDIPMGYSWDEYNQVTEILPWQENIPLQYGGFPPYW